MMAAGSIPCGDGIGAAARKRKSHRRAVTSAGKALRNPHNSHRGTSIAGSNPVTSKASAISGKLPQEEVDPEITQERIAEKIGEEGEDGRT